jgi:hypothetical protein
MTTIYEAALSWLHQGRGLVPLQPGSKRIVGGFGAYLRRITEEGEAAAWFRDRQCNLAVVLGDGVLCLDFDRESDYETWAPSSAVAESYTEKTRCGFHVFLAGESANGVGAGYEILAVGRVVTVAPSVVGGFVYQVEKPTPISRINADFPLLSELSEPKREKLTMTTSDHGDVLTRIKAAWRVEDVALSGGIILRGSRSVTWSGRWLSGLCPFHGDRHPSLWVDTERGLWGCRACNAHGDVINLYARLHGLSVGDAIKAMAAVL